MTTLTEQELAVLNEQERGILEREQKASPGPWFRVSPGQFTIVYSPDHTGGGRDVLYGDNRTLDGNFMAHARTDVPYLLTRVARLRLELAELERELDNPGQR